MRSFHVIKSKIKNVSTRGIHVLFIGCTLGMLLGGCDFDAVKELQLDRNDTGIVGAKAQESNERKDDSEDIPALEKSDDVSIIDRMEEEDTDTSGIGELNNEPNTEKVITGDASVNDSNYDVSDSLCYAYGRLGATEKQAYSEILGILDSMYEDVALTTVEPNEVEHAFECVMADHPELFYVKGYSIGKYKLGNTITKIIFSGNYTHDKSEVKSKKKQVEQYISNVIQNAPSGDDYDRIKYVYEYLIKNNTYDIEGENNQNILSVIENGRTVCSGYAKMTQLILNRMGIFCTLVNGTACGSEESNDWESHVWNIVKCNGEYYHVDTTWGDASFNLSDMYDDSIRGVEINYEYLLVRDSDIKGTHEADPVVDMPTCNSLTDNYYVREGCYFEDVNDDQLQSVFADAYAQGKSTLFLKAADSTGYDELYERLITEQYIFECVTQNNVMYALYPEKNMILIEL